MLCANAEAIAAAAPVARPNVGSGPSATSVFWPLATLGWMSWSTSCMYSQPPSLVPPGPRLSPLLGASAAVPSITTAPGLP